MGSPTGERRESLPVRLTGKNFTSPMINYMSFLITREFEAFSGTESEGDADSSEEESESDGETERELLDYFDSEGGRDGARRQSSPDDILEAVQAVKLSYSSSFSFGQTTSRTT